MTVLRSPIPVATFYGPPRYVVAMAPYQCDHCQYLTLAMINTSDPDLDGLMGTNRLTGATWLPLKGHSKDFPDVPEPIGATASEAHRCLSVGAPRGAVALARAVIESTAKAQQITTGNLAAKIDELANRGHIREAVREATHEVRIDGNEVAHGDLVSDPVSAEDAEDVLQLMDEILAEVFQGPATVQRVRDRRNARRDEGGGRDRELS